MNIKSIVICLIICTSPSTIKGNNVFKAIENIHYGKLSQQLAPILETEHQSISTLFSNCKSVAYNPTTRQYKEVSMLVNDALKKLAYDYYKPTKKKEGGEIVKLQDGGSTYARDVYAQVGQYGKDMLNKKEADLDNKVKSQGRTKEQVKAFIGITVGFMALVSIIAAIVFALLYTKEKSKIYNI